MRVLIADDQRDVGRSLADLVRCCNHDIVAVVGSGLEAIQAYTRYHPDLVLMDYRMPKFNGATACRNILSKDPLARIILVTGWSPSDEAGASGAIAILPKPVDFERLNATLQSVAQMLPVPAPAELPMPGLYFQPDPLPSPSSELPTPISELPSSTFDLPSSCSELPTPSSDLPSPGFDFPTPSPPADGLAVASFEVAPPSLEMIFPINAPPDIFQHDEESPVLNEPKISVKHRNNRRRLQRTRVR
jgi:CheY-like chemotaxis protein